WFLWPRPRTWRDIRSSFPCPIQITAGVATFLIIMFSCGVVSYPSETVYQLTPSIPFLPNVFSENKFGRAQFISVHKLLFDGDWDQMRLRRHSPWSATLIAPRARPEVLASSRRAEVSLRGRDLNGAYLLASHLDGLDFTSVKLNYA